MKKTNLTIKETFDLAVENHRKNNFKVAEGLYQEVLKINTNHFESIFLLGSLSAQIKNFDKAKQLLYEAIRINPNYPDAHNNLGNVLKEIGEYQEARRCYEKAIQINPNYADAHNNLGGVLKELGNFQEAIEYCRKAIEIQPDYANAYYNLGILFKESKDLQESLNCYQKSIKIQPNYPNAHNNLGVVLSELGKHEEAIDCYKRAIHINPKYVDAYYNLASSLNDLARLKEAVIGYYQVIKLRPNFAMAYSNLLFNLNYKTDFDPNLYLIEAKKFRKNCAPKKKLSFKYQFDKQPKKLRLGLVSADFGNHPGGFFTLSTLSELAKKDFELIAYSNFDRDDELSPHFKPLFSKWRSIEKEKDDEVAEQILKDGVHILIDLQGHSAKNRLPIFMYKAAPIQLSWLGQGSTGISDIDYFVGSPHITPTSEENHYVEKIWRLPEISQCFTIPNFDVKINNLPAIKNNFITFGSFNTFAKISTNTIILWSKTLSSIPNSKLILKSKEFDDKKFSDRILNKFKENNIGKERLIFYGKSQTRKDVLKIYNEIDIGLDPFPFQGNTTTCESVWMGVPVITLKGDRYLFHFGESINANLNMHDWIANNHEEYISKAIKFSSNLDQLSKIRMNLRKTALQSPVFDAPRFAEHFNKMLWDMWKEFNNKK